jgi:hypothetical protein
MHYLDDKETRVCPCADGFLYGNFRDSEQSPEIQCNFCVDTHYWFWQINRNDWSGHYWYEWTLRLHPT